MRGRASSQAISFPFLLLLIGVLLPSCAPGQSTLEPETPLVPVELVTQGGGVIPWRAPLHVRDAQLYLAQFTDTGERTFRTYDEVTFPADVMVVYSEDLHVATVFLRRSPHGGCLLLWDPNKGVIHDACFGSKFDLAGQHISGPSRRNLDQLPANVRDGIIWVLPEVVYGGLHP